VGESQTLIIRGEYDIITARLLVRRLARAKGFDIADQARIALASSSLAYSLGLGMRQGQVTIDSLNDGARTGVRVVCTEAGGATRDLAPEALDSVRFMVDELTIETLPGDDLQITLVKWMDDSRGAEREGGAHD
jgi:serine/threonine-protein kinase RsbT